MDYFKRLENLQNHLEKLECDALIIENLTDIYYLCGIDLSSGKLVVHPSGAALFVDSRYYELCKKKSPFPVVLSLDSSALTDWLFSPEANSITTLGFDSSTSSYKQWSEWKTLLAKKGKKSLTQKKLKLVPLDSPIADLRRVKDKQEIRLLGKAANLGTEGFHYVCSKLTEGITEQELAIALEIFWKEKGSQGLAFSPIIAFGKNSSMPHHRAGATKLQSGDIVLIDIGVLLDYYHSDMTRCVFFGPPQKKLIEIYEIVRQAQEMALAMCRPGVLIEELDRAARSYIASKGHQEHFTHGLGHGVGLQIHEGPSLSQKSADKTLPLEEGMVITIEPGIYLPEIGGVRIEDTVVITDKGHKNLTKAAKTQLVIDKA